MDYAKIPIQCAANAKMTPSYGADNGVSKVIELNPQKVYDDKKWEYTQNLAFKNDPAIPGNQNF